MSNFTAIYDACVLYPAVTRDLLLTLATSDLFRARWTEEIQAEWVRALQKKRSDIPPERINRICALMEKAVPDCLVTGYEGLISNLDLPDPNDRHVLAAAIRCQAGVIVTYNLKDFPSDVLHPYGIEVQHPDDFVFHLMDLYPGAVYGAAKEQRQRLGNPPKTPDDYLGTLRARGFVQVAAHLEQFKHLI